MRVAVFSTKSYDHEFLSSANDGPGHELRFLEPRLTADTAPLAEGCGAVCAFVNDDLGKATLQRLATIGVGLVALRSAGHNHVDLDAAADLDLTVAHVPAYSPHAVAEHAVGLVLALNRKIHRAYNRVRENNFSLTGLMGFDLHGRTAARSVSSAPAPSAACSAGSCSASGAASSPSTPAPTRGAPTPGWSTSTSTSSWPSPT